MSELLIADCHIFTPKSLIDIYFKKQKNLFCAFIDYSKSFDSVWRPGLRYKLIKSRITGKMYTLIYNMYISPILRLHKFILLWRSVCCSALQSRKAVSTYLSGKQILSLGSTWHSERVCHRHLLNTRCI